MTGLPCPWGQRQGQAGGGAPQHGNTRLRQQLLVLELPHRFFNKSRQCRDSADSLSHILHLSTFQGLIKLLIALPGQEGSVAGSHVAAGLPGGLAQSS